MQEELKERLQVSLVTVKHLMASLQQRNMIARQGSSRNGEWVVLGKK